jgi:DNA-directed RNA polymerase subunit M/transcription elongation factor TFIIS
MSWDMSHYPQNMNEIRDRILFRDKHQCQRCGANYPALTCHHRVTAREGDHSPENLVILCDFCHSFLHPHLNIGKKKPLRIRTKTMKLCNRCKKEYSYEYQEKFCVECGSFLHVEKKEIITPIDIYTIDRSRDSWFIVLDINSENYKMIYNNRLEMVKYKEKNGWFK